MAIMSLKNIKQNINSVPVKIIKYSKDIICHPLSHLIIMSFSMGEFPESFKYHIEIWHRIGDVGETRLACITAGRQTR